MVKKNSLWSMFIMMISIMMSMGFVACGGDDDDGVKKPTEQTDNNGNENGGTEESDNDGTDDKAPANVQAVDLGLSVKWANMNIGATDEADLGKYYAWGAVTDNLSEGKEYTPKNTPFYYDLTNNGYVYDYSKYSLVQDNKSKLQPEDDAASVNWGGSWRMPTKKEFIELFTKTSISIESLPVYNIFGHFTGKSVPGFRFTGLKEGYTDKSIFLPAAGYYYKSLELKDEKSAMWYWSSELGYYSTEAYCLKYGMEEIEQGSTTFVKSLSRNYGLPIRAVK